MWRVYFFFSPYLSVYVRTYTLDTYAYASARLPVCVCVYVEERVIKNVNVCS